MDSLTRPQLLALARQRGYHRYHKLNKRDLVQLLETGRYRRQSPPPPPPRPRYTSVHSSRGLRPDEIDLDRYRVDVSRRSDGQYLVRGVDLNGLFGSVFVDDRTVRGAPQYDDTDTEGSDDDDTYVVNGGWVVPASQIQNLRTYLSSLRVYNPRSLFDLSALSVNRRPINQYLPEHFLQRVRSVR